MANLPRPPFYPGPHGSWVSREEGWTPNTIWDLVVRPPVFTCLPSSGRRITSFIEDFYGPPPRKDPQSPTYTTVIDPCYFSPRLLTPPACDVSVLSTIWEERSEDISESIAFGDIGVQTGDGEEVLDIEFLAADGIIENSDGEDKAGCQFREVGVQTILHSPHHQRTVSRWG